MATGRAIAISRRFVRPSPPARLVLIETEATTRLPDFAFAADDVLILGRESAGAGPEVTAAAAAIVRVPMAAGLRSLNVVTAAAMALYEALRQTGGLEKLA
jgi:tRNA (cytidine/uridine-2'-O-)-methyltransferase